MGSNVAHFRFYEELNDFLPPDKKKLTFPYRFNGTPAVKDAIEAIGAPHTEVDLILVNGRSVGFDYQLQPGDRVAVYPVFESLDISPLVRLREKPLRETKFVLDVHLGKLARLLRLLGFDTLYQNDFEDSQIIELSVQGRRIILTRDIGILKNKAVTHGYWLRSTDPETQLQEVVEHFDLLSQVKPFQRCLECNGLIEKVAKKEVQDQLPPKTTSYYNEFYRCASCGKVYWRGSHHEKLNALVQKFVD